MTLADRILQKDALEPIDRAIEALPPDDPLRDEIAWARDTLLDQIEPLALLHSEASQVIAGNQVAARRFEALLEKLAIETEPETDVALDEPVTGGSEKEGE